MIGHADTRAGLLRVERLNFTLSAGAVAASFALFTPQIATSVAAGALVEVANFRAMHASARRFFGGEFGGISAGGQGGVAAESGAHSDKLADMADHGVSTIRWWMPVPLSARHSGMAPRSGVSV